MAHCPTKLAGISPAGFYGRDFRDDHYRGIRNYSRYSFITRLIIGPKAGHPYAEIPRCILRLKSMKIYALGQSLTILYGGWFPRISFFFYIGMSGWAKCFFRRVVSRVGGLCVSPVLSCPELN